MITISEFQPFNEIEHFQTHQYLSSCYCYWRTAEFDMVQIKPLVITLPVHLENEQNVLYVAQPKQAEESLQRHIDTPLTGCFHINEMASKLAREPDPQNLKEILYEDFPSYFVWNNKDHFWSSRQDGNS